MASKEKSKIRPTHIQEYIKRPFYEFLSSITIVISVVSRSIVRTYSLTSIVVKNSSPGIIKSKLRIQLSVYKVS